jgi:hypothetical protein
MVAGVLLYSCVSYHQEQALPTASEPCTKGAAYGGVVLRFHGVSNLLKLLICGF